MLPRTMSSYGMSTGSPPDRVREVGRLAERPLETRRRDVDRVPVEIAPQNVRHPLAERVVDAGGMVDVDAEALRRQELDREHLDPRQAALDRLGHLALERLLGSSYVRHVTSFLKKNGRGAPISPSR